MKECIACKYSRVDDDQYRAHGCPECTCKMYKVRCWNPHLDRVDTCYVSLDTIIRSPEKLQINMIDVGFHLLNLKREELGLEPMKADSISGYTVHLVFIAQS